MPATTASDVELIIQTLESKLAAGIVEIQFEGRKTVYSTGADKVQALSYFRNKLLALSVTESLTPMSRVSRLYSDKGL